MTSSPTRPRLAEEHRTRRRRLGCLVGSVLVGALLVTSVWVGVEWFRSGMDLGGPMCRATASGTTVSFSPEQMDNAATIVGIGVGRGLPARAGTIAIATAIQESKLRNIDYGDRDSLGLFQQRPSQGWGTPEQILTPEYSTNAFYDALVRIDGYQDMVITEVAQEVQRSAYPDAYADHETEGRVIASTLAGHTAESMVCRLDSPTAHTVHDDLVTDLQAHLGVTGTLAADGRALTIDAASEQQAWSIGQYLVAKAERHSVTEVQVDDRQWVRRSGPSSLQWQAAEEPVGQTRVVAALTPTPTPSEG